jgi:alkylated DNA repair dioxygenase AlkB
MLSIIKTDKSYLNLLSYADNYIVREIIDKCIDEVKDCLDIKPSIKFMGKIVYQQRDIGFFSNETEGYYYSGKLASSKPLKPNLVELLKIVNTLFGSSYNGILVNRYNDGTNYISEHSDNENTLDDIGVVAISYGAIRKFRIRNKITKVKVIDIPTTSYSLIQMGGNFQNEFLHGIPIEKKILDVRYSLTFRKHIEIS